MAGDTEKVLIDTDILIGFLRGRASAKALLQAAHRAGDCCCSVITVAELYAGMRASETTATEALLAGLNILPVTPSIARLAGSLRQHNKSKPPAYLADCLIAATAITEGCKFITGNRKDYPFPGLQWLTTQMA